MPLNLLEKTELWVHDITLEGANLTELAKTVAGVLGLREDKVLVVDVRPAHITLDILETDIPEENLIGREGEILGALSGLEGVSLGPDAAVHSNGILGLICLRGEDPEGMARRIRDMTGEMQARIAKRAIVFPTGFEVRDGLIEDTNTPYLRELLEARGYKVDTGPVIEDSADDTFAKLDDAVSRAYGLILTTGGVGAEDKDFSVEGLLRVDPDAATPYIVKFEKGTGRHVKDGVRIAVGQVGPSLLVALPGPNDEVRIGADELLRCLEAGCGADETAHRIAGVLAEKLLQKRAQWHGHHHDRQDQPPGHHQHHDKQSQALGHHQHHN